MIKIKEAIIVEGRYDKNMLSQLVDATIIETKGFGVFSDPERLALIRRLAEKRGVILLTDSDGAGFVIRGHLKGKLQGMNVKNAYIPEIAGKEKRKRRPSREGTLGVEGMTPQILLRALETAGATVMDGGPATSANMPPVTKADLFRAGLTGTGGSAARRQELLQRLQLPAKLSTNALLEVLNALYTREEFLQLMSGV